MVKGLPARGRGRSSKWDKNADKFPPTLRRSFEERVTRHEQHFHFQD
jgi:hypothetical protein